MNKTEAERLREQGLTIETVADLLNGPVPDPGPAVPARPPKRGDGLPPIGHNQPPEESPFEAIKSEIDDLMMEARHWLDGAGVQNEEQASAVAVLRDKIRDAAKRADALRKEEAKPFDDGKAEVQARYNPLIAKDRGVCDLAVQTCNNVLKPFLKAKEEAQRAEALRLQREAQEAAYAAQKAAMEASGTQDLDQRENVEAMLENAKSLLAVASRADKAKPQVEGGARAVGMKSVWIPELADPAAALAHYRQEQPARLKEFLLELARTDVRSGKRAIPGFIIKEDRIPV